MQQCKHAAIGLAVALGLLVGSAWSGGSVPTAPVGAEAPTDIVELFPVCNNVALTWNTGTPMSTVAASVSPQDALESIWRYDTAADRWLGYSTLPDAPNDYTTVGARAQAAWICMRAPGSLDRPTI